MKLVEIEYSHGKRYKLYEGDTVMYHFFVKRGELMTKELDIIKEMVDGYNFAILHLRNPNKIIADFAYHRINSWDKGGNIDIEKRPF